MCPLLINDILHVLRFNKSVDVKCHLIISKNRQNKAYFEGLKLERRSESIRHGDLPDTFLARLVVLRVVGT